VHNLLLVGIIVLATVVYFLIIALFLRIIGKLTPQFSSYYDFGKSFPGAGRLGLLIYSIVIVVFIIAILVLAGTNLTVIHA